MWRQTRFREISDREKALSMEKPWCYSKNNELKLDNFPASSYNTVPPLSCKMSLLAFLFWKFLHLLPSHIWGFSVQELSLLLLAQIYLNGFGYFLLKNRKDTLKPQIPVVIHWKSSYYRTEQVKWPKLQFIFLLFLVCRNLCRTPTEKRSLNRLFCSLKFYRNPIYYKISSSCFAW